LYLPIPWGDWSYAGYAQGQGMALACGVSYFDTCVGYPKGGHKDLYVPCPWGMITLSRIHVCGVFTTTGYAGRGSVRAGGCMRVILLVLLGVLTPESWVLAVCRWLDKRSDPLRHTEQH